MRKEIEDEMKSKYQNNQNEIIQHSEEIEVKTKATPKQPVIMKPPPQRQLTASELLQQSYNEMKKLKQQEKAEKMARFKTSMF